MQHHTTYRHLISWQKSYYTCYKRKSFGFHDQKVKYKDRKGSKIIFTWTSLFLVLKNEFELIIHTYYICIVRKQKNIMSVSMWIEGYFT